MKLVDKNKVLQVLKDYLDVESQVELMYNTSIITSTRLIIKVDYLIRITSNHFQLMLGIGRIGNDPNNFFSLGSELVLNHYKDMIDKLRELLYDEYGLHK